LDRLNLPSWFYRRWAAPLLLALVVIGFYWKLVLTNQFTWLAQPDLSAMVLPWFQFQASEVHAGRFPLWDQYAWGGQPNLAPGQPGAAYPLNWLLFLAPLKHTWIRQAYVHWYYVVVRILSALTMFLFCRDLGRSRKAALVAGAVYGVGGYLGSIEWPAMVNGAAWVPLIFLFQFRAARGFRPVPSAAVSGFFLGLAWLCGHHQLPLFVSLGYAFLWLYLILRNSFRPDYLLLRCAAIAVGVGMLVSGFQTIPIAEYGKLSRRWVSIDHPVTWRETVPYAVHGDYSVKPLSILSIFIPGLDSNENPFVGAVAFALALAGVVLAWKDERVRWLAMLALGALVFALGPNSVFHGFLYAVVPMLEKARVPAQGMILFHLGVSALVAFGLDRFVELSRRGMLVLAIALASLGALLGMAGFVLFETRVLPLHGDTRFMVTALAAVAGAVVLWTAWSGTLPLRTAAAVLLGFVLLELGNTSGYFFASYERDKTRTADLRRMAEDADIVEYLRQWPGPFRVEYDGEAIPHNFGDWWGVETFTSYVAGAPDIVLRNDPYNPRVEALLGVRYYLGLKPLRPDETEVFKGASGRKVYQFPDAFPRVWTVHHVTRVNQADTARALSNPAIDLRAQAIVTRELAPLEQCSGDTVEIARHVSDQVVLNADMQCKGMVLLSETYYPGWQASIDGRKAEIFDADGMIRGVVADRGRHVIVMKYRPRSVLLGGAMTLMGTLLTAFLFIRSSRPRSARTSPMIASTA
jgi:hypothetical protein